MLWKQYHLFFCVWSVLFVIGFSSSVLIGLKKFKKEENYVYSIVYTKCDYVRVYDVRVDKTRKILNGLLIELETKQEYRAMVTVVMF